MKKPSEPSDNHQDTLELTPEQYAKVCAICAQLEDYPTAEWEERAVDLCSDNTLILEWVRRFTMLENSYGDSVGFEEMVSDIEVVYEDTSREGELIDRYLLKEKLSETRLSEVYLAECQVTGLKMVVKLLNHEMWFESREEAIAKYAQLIYGERDQLARIEEILHVAKLESVGTTGDGVPYIVTRYIPGRHIDDYCREKELDRDQILRLFIKVCKIVAAAHNLSIVHRDLKPNNIMVQGSVDQPMPHLLDFGISAVISNRSDDDTDDLVKKFGPAAKFQPPIKEIQSFTQRSDIYSLGCVLIHLLEAWRSRQIPTLWHRLNPFGHITGGVKKAIPGGPDLKQNVSSGREETEGEIGNPYTVDKMREIIRNLQLPYDLTFVLNRCITKSPEDRYANVNDLSGELERIVAKEPILELCHRYHYRLGRFFIRRPYISIITLILLGFLSVRAYEINYIAPKQLECRTRLEQDALNLKQDLRTIYNSPLEHLQDNRLQEMIEERRSKVAELEHKTREWRRLCRGDAAHVLGQVYYLVGRHHEALEHLERAWKLVPDKSQLPYDLGLTYIALYEQTAWEASGKRNYEIRRQTEQRAQTYLEQALFYQKRCRDLDEEQALYLNALITFYQERNERLLAGEPFAQALSQVKDCVAIRSWDYRYHELKGQIYRSRGVYYQERGRHEEALQAFDQAEVALNMALSYSQARPELHEAMVHLWFNRQTSLKDPDERQTMLKKAIDKAELVTRLMPDQPRAYRMLSRLLFRLHGASDWDAPQARAVTLARQAFDRAALLKSKQEDLTEYVASGHALALALMKQAGWKLEHGDPGHHNDLDEASSILHLVGNEHDGYETACYLARLHLSLYYAANGLEEKLSALEQAIKFCHKAIEKNEDGYWARQLLLFAQTEDLYLRIDHQRDRDTYQKEMEQRFARGFQLVETLPKGKYRLNISGNLYKNYALYLKKIGKNPGEALKREQEYFLELSKEPGGSLALIDLAENAMERALTVWEQGGNPAPVLQEAVTFAERYLNKHPDKASGLRARGEIELKRARLQYESGQSPLKALSDAASYMQRAYELGHDRKRTLRHQAEIALLRSGFPGRKGQQYRLEAERILDRLTIENQGAQDAQVQKLSILLAEQKAIAGRLAKEGTPQADIQQLMTAYTETRQHDPDVIHFEVSYALRTAWRHLMANRKDEVLTTVAWGLNAQKRLPRDFWNHDRINAENVALLLMKAISEEDCNGVTDLRQELQRLLDDNTNLMGSFRHYLDFETCNS